MVHFLTNTNQIIAPVAKTQNANSATRFIVVTLTQVST
jgi:hypothetical protein